LALVLQIAVLLVVLIGLITIIMSIKNWHWAQMVLVLSIFFMAIATLFLGMETFRIHRNIRKAIPGLEKKLAEVEEENRALQFGARNDDPAVMRIFDGRNFRRRAPLRRRS
jgi:c-di-AMP phosphodiesterase-like protein